MKNIKTMAFTALAITMTSCATPPPPQVFHQTDATALVIESLDDTTCQLIQPVASGKENNDTALTKAMELPQREAAVVILENYNESTFGAQFRDRGTAWFVGLRNLGYQHIIFLQGKGVTDPEGLITLVQYE